MALTERASKLQDMVTVCKALYRDELGVECEEEVDDEDKKNIWQQHALKDKAKSHFDDIMEVYVTFGSMRTM